MNQRIPGVTSTHWHCIECHAKHPIEHAGGIFPKGMTCQGMCTAIQQALARNNQHLARKLRTLGAKSRALAMKTPPLKVGDVVVGTRIRRRVRVR